jgi:hypothetical protein
LGYSFIFLLPDIENWEMLDDIVNIFTESIRFYHTAYLMSRIFKVFYGLEKVGIPPFFS